MSDYITREEHDEFKGDISSYLKYTANNDGTNPTKEGYEKFYVPYVEAKLKLL